MRKMLCVPIVLVAACSGGEDRSTPVDIDNAARSAQNNIDNYTADAIPAPAVRPTAAAPTPTPREIVNEAPFPPDSAQAAADVVQTYYALLESGKYRDAWTLWDDDGHASGMTATAFAASFDKYADYHADVGAPGRIDAGAGQRYVTVPVKVYGTLKAGDRPFALSGGVTLHRAADIDGATAAQKSWRINSADLKPTPAEATAGSAGLRHRPD